MSNFTCFVRAITGLVVCAIWFVNAGCSREISSEKIVAVRGVRFVDGQVQDKIISSQVVRQMCQSLQGENEGRYPESEEATWWREEATGKKVALQGASHISKESSPVFYPMTGTNGWLGIDLYCSIIGTIIPIRDDKLGRGVQVRVYPEYSNQLRIVKYFFGDPQHRLSEEEEQKLYDLFLFDGNRRLMYRTFNPNQQYYEYNALDEKLTEVTTNRVAEVKRTYRDMYRIPLNCQDYWDKAGDGKLRPISEYYRPLDLVGDAVPQMGPE